MQAGIESNPFERPIAWAVNEYTGEYQRFYATTPQDILIKHIQLFRAGIVLQLDSHIPIQTARNLVANLPAAVVVFLSFDASFELVSAVASILPQGRILGLHPETPHHIFAEALTKMQHRTLFHLYEGTSASTGYVVGLNAPVGVVIEFERYLSIETGVAVASGLRQGAGLCLHPRHSERIVREVASVLNEGVSLFIHPEMHLSLILIAASVAKDTVCVFVDGRLPSDVKRDIQNARVFDESILKSKDVSHIFNPNNSRPYVLVRNSTQGFFSKPCFREPSLDKNYTPFQGLKF